VQAKPFSYKEYLELIAESSAIKMHENSNRVIERYRTSEYEMSNHTGAIFLVEFTTKKYIYISEGVFDMIGYTVKQFQEQTLDEYLGKIHPLDFEIMNKKIFPENMRFLRTINCQSYQDFIFSYNYRVPDFKGDYVTILQRASYIPSNEDAMPFGMIGVGFNITHFKNDVSVIQTIEKTMQENGQSRNELLLKKVYPVIDNENSNFLSRKELEVLSYISGGYSSKQIADKMNISIYTVNNHRRNMLLKSKCKSSSELINYASKHGLL